MEFSHSREERVMALLRLVIPLGLIGLGIVVGTL